MVNGSGYAQKNGAMQGYRKRTTFSATNKKKLDPQKERDEELLALDTVDAESCWKIYRLEEDACDQHIPPQPKQKNCRQNPYCIHRLGLEKFDKLHQSQKGTAAAEALTRRNPNSQPCGLVNYGNFCYVNSFLQIWFNDLRFRQSVYDWRPHADWQKPPDAKLDIQEVMNCMQRLFLTLQLTPFETTDARDFIQLLRLDNEQQDVQEFHTLFFDNLERNLELHPNGQQIRASIRHLFQSRIRQTTVCNQCGKRSEAESEYRSLPLSIDGFNSLSAALDHFFGEERLGDFKCGQCGVTGETCKLMGYVQLPQVLIIQLNRYVYDSAKERHKKLRTAIPFPRVLKANKLKQDAAYDDEFDLSAVMIHEGPNTHCGHYYDIVRDPLTKCWFTYNDKQVQMEKRAPGYEGPREPKETSRATNDQKGCYALIYQRKTPPNNEQDAAGDEAGHGVHLRLPPEELVKEVCQKLEDDFTRQSKEGNRSNRLWEYRITQRHTYLNELVRELEVKEGRLFVNRPEEIVFLPTSLLGELFGKEFEAVKEMRNLDVVDLDFLLLQSPMKQTPLKRKRKECVEEGEENNLDRDKENSSSSKQGEQEMDQPPARPLTASGHKQLSRTGTASTGHRPLSRDDESLLSFDGFEHAEQLGGKGTGAQFDCSFDYASYEHIYAPEPVGDVHFVLCKHGKIPLDALTNGQLKAVHVEGANRLISEFNIRWFVHAAEEQWQKEVKREGVEQHMEVEDGPDQPCTSAAAAERDEDGMLGLARNLAIHSSPSLGEENNERKGKGQKVAATSASPAFLDNRVRTGEDLCTECVKSMKREACYRNNLAETERMLAETMRNLAKRTHDPGRDTPFPPHSPPKEAVWVSLDHLKRFKKIALTQMEKAGRLSMTSGGGGSEEPAEKRAKAASEDLEQHESALAGATGFPRSKEDNDIQIIDDGAGSSSNSNNLNNVTERHQRRHSEGEAGYLTADENEREDGEEGEKKVTEYHLNVDGLEVQAVHGGQKEEEGESKAEVLDLEAKAASPARFNEEIYCKHGKLSYKAKRVWLGREEWARLKLSFIDFCEPIPCDTAECHECIEEFNILNDVRESSMNQLQNLHSSIRPLLTKLFNRRSWDDLELGHVFPFVICKEYILKMRNILNRSKQKQTVEIPPICQDCLLCNHALPYLPLPQQGGEEDGGGLFPIFPGCVSAGRRKEPQHPQAVPMMESEWLELLEAYREHVPEQSPPVPIQLNQQNGQYQLFCDQCHLEFNQREELKRFQYPQGADIYVKMKGDESEDQVQAKAVESSSSRTMTTRRGSQKNLYSFKMRSTQTVADLKLELMHKTRQSPNDQLLYLGDKVLDGELTLEEAQVAPNSRDNPLVLIVQQRLDTDSVSDGASPRASGPRPLEKGFKDTALSA